MREGRSAPRIFCMRCQVIAMVEPPAPIENISAAVRSKWRSGRKPSIARPEEIGSLAWQTSLPCCFDRQLVSPMSSAWGSTTSKRSRQASIKIDLVRGDQRAERLRIVFQERDRRPIGFGRRMERKIDALDHGAIEPEALGPGWKHPHDRALRRRHAEEVERRRRRWFERGHRRRRVTMRRRRRGRCVRRTRPR